jgi:hypothetical protein
VDDVRRIADAVLYEGYLLWPYRRSALKNQRRWTFGGVHPPAHTWEHPDDRCALRAECLLVGDAGAGVEVAVRFLHVVVREDGWEEATERELTSGPLHVAALLGGVQLPIAVAAGAAGGRRWDALAGTVEIRARRLTGDVLRLTVTVANATPFAGGGRQAALRRTFCSAHAVLAAAGGARFASLTDPPPALREAAAACVNDGVWPVLVGPPGSDTTMLASPIILEDHPQIAPESPGDLFDGGEIDQLLTLSILALTDDEKAQMREADPRTRAILERTEALSREQLMALHAEMRR